MIDPGRIAAWAALALASLSFLNLCLVGCAEILAPRRQRSLKFGAARVHAWQSGAGCPVLYLHDDAANGHDFEIGPALHLPEGFLHVLMDRPGHGYSNAPRGHESLSGQAASAAKVLEEMSIERAVIAAHGAGAAVALRLALERPDLVRALVLAAPSIHAPVKPLFPLSDLPAAPLLGWLHAFGLAPFAYVFATQARLKRRFLPQRPPRAFARRSRDILGARPGALLARRRLRRQFASECALQAVRYPQIAAHAIILSADQDALAVPEDNGRALYAALRRAELVILPGMGHMLHHKRAQAVAAAIRRAAAFVPDSPARA